MTEACDWDRGGWDGERRLTWRAMEGVHLSTYDLVMGRLWEGIGRGQGEFHGSLCWVDFGLHKWYYHTLDLKPQGPEFRIHDRVRENTFSHLSASTVTCVVHLCLMGDDSNNRPKTALPKRNDNFRKEKPSAKAEWITCVFNLAVLGQYFNASRLV